jgi:hypothetical protein
MGASPNKKKATARENANQRVAGRRDAPREPSAPTDKEASQGRFAGETPLTGEDRPSDRPGGKKEGQVAKRQGGRS